MIPWHQRQSTLFGDPEPVSMASRLQQARERHLRLWQTPGVAVADIAAAADEVIVATVRWDLDEIACRQLRRQPRSWRDGAVVEIMGHREHRGEVRHKPGGGIEVRELQDDGTLGQPIYYGSSAIFAIRYVSCREALIKEER